MIHLIPTKPLPKTILFVFIALFFGQISAQRIPALSKLDTVSIKTNGYRPVYIKIANRPRGVFLATPFPSFLKTKPLTEKYKPFIPPSFWTKKNQLDIKLSEVAFVNWNAGGENSISTLGNMEFERNYKFRYIQWDNSLRFRYGLNAQDGRKVRKTNDEIRFASTFGFRKDTITNWYYSLKANFNTQFSNGYKYPDRDNPISRFMAPGYVFLGAGTSYIPEGKKLNFYFSPITHKATYVLDQDLANQGAFGVKKALIDDEGNIIKEGESRYMELGILITNSWETTVAENILLNNRINLYTDYLHSFGNVDLDWELNLNLKVNQYVNASIGTHVIFDDDIKFDEEIANDGTIINPGEPKIQFKQLLGVGIGYIF
ncbi:hypothetical protein GGR42_002147 [Saonia flava]|uniref:DUF3078 domain-containing protein n=1 Tax=Saonia flava TaxID=523696 RepID=A0A846R167_9FLAO|nr:DUF3078 domain-containing protein [Saonia flava]NJB71685.1 hypothetical protein [Saonia flava]